MFNKIIQVAVDVVGVMAIFLFLAYSFFSTVKDLLKKSDFFILSPTSKIYKWLQQDYNSSLLSKAFSDLGYSKSENDACIENIRNLSNKVRSNIVYKKANRILHLISLLSKYTQYFNKEIQYGKQTPTKSEYYINTMEASHDKKDLVLMSHLICDLINDIGIVPDFIVTPKSGNPLLCNAISSHYGEKEVCFLLKKQKEERSKALLSLEEDPLNYFKTNFEGSNKLLDKIKNNNKSKLNGVVVDCNLSGGSQVLDIIDEINNIIELTKVGLKKIEHVFVLFRVDMEKIDIDWEFNEKGCKLIRYIDLDEQMKGRLYSLKINDQGEVKELCPASNIGRKKMLHFLGVLASENKLKIEVSNELKKELQSS